MISTVILYISVRRAEKVLLSLLFYCLEGGECLEKKFRDFRMHCRRLLQSEKGEISYISTFLYILVAVILIAFIINVFQIISAKQQMDHAVDQIVKQIQLNGGVNSETDSLFLFLSGEISGAEGLEYTVECSDSEDRIQIGSPFYVTMTGRCNLGGFWNFRLVNITIRSVGAGVSEHYWK